MLSRIRGPQLSGMGTLELRLLDGKENTDRALQVSRRTLEESLAELVVARQRHKCLEKHTICLLSYG
jgi:hypothetical protein